MKVLVTGAGGFLGKAVVKHLLASGHSVRAFLRKPPETYGLSAGGIEIASGDVTSLDSAVRAVAGCEAVIHLASLYRFGPWWKRESREIYNTNVGGTRVMLEAALRHNVRKFIFTSSIATIGKENGGKASDEETAFNLWRIASHYARSKLLAEYEVLKYCARGLSALILNPAVIIGEGDSRPTPSGELIANFLNRRYPCYYNASFTFADADDVAETHVAALHKGRVGERYILANSSPCTVEEIFLLLEKISGIKAPAIKLPYPLMLYAAGIDELLSCFILRKQPLISVRSLQFGHLPVTFDNSRAVKELSYSSSPIEKTLAKAVAWYRANGYVSDPDKTGKVFKK